MNKLCKITVISLAVSGLLGISQSSTVIAATKSGSTSKGTLPKGKPFQYLNSRIDTLQAQIDFLIGEVASIQEWIVEAKAVLLTLQQNTAANAAAIAVLQGQIANVEAILATKQDIITGTCPAGQYVYAISQSPSTLICRADLGANGLSAFTVQTTQDIQTTVNAVVTAPCPTGSVPTGGSFGAPVGLTIHSSVVDTVNNGYTVNATNITAGPLTLNVTAICVGIAP